MQLLNNLIPNELKQNAVDFSPDQGRIGITLTQREKVLTLTVEDDGPGIPENQIQQVLQRGIRADENVSGHGIGMAIVNDISTAYGGKVNITKSKLGGCLIEVVFPGT